MKITDKNYDKALKNNSPNWWIRTGYKYFSSSTTEKNLRPSKILVGVFFSLFLAGFFGTVIEIDRSILKPITLAYFFGLSTLVGSLFSVVIMNNLRIKRIIKELGCTLKEYSSYVTIRNAKDKK